MFLPKKNSPNPASFFMLPKIEGITFSKKLHFYLSSLNKKSISLINNEKEAGPGNKNSKRKRSIRKMEIEYLPILRRKVTMKP